MADGADILLLSSPPMRSILVVIFMLLPAAAFGQSCPQPLASANKLVLVVADTLSSNTAQLQRFTRASPQSPWQADGGGLTALVGRNGMAWGYAFRGHARPGEPVKTEGDKRAPAGFYRIGSSFGFAASARPGHLHIREGTVCVDDAASSAYNTISSRTRVGPKVHGENMWRVPDYRHGLLVDYPSSRAARGGSCIFIHLWMPNKTGTGGCVALPEPQLTRLQDFAQGGAVLAVLPRQALDRFKGCLP
jgi:L,D-peptidoglycan transpeptidase YkuD (ErfK/YbiS/YcfS/YnhG family)